MKAAPRVGRKRQAIKCKGHCSDGRPCANYAMNGSAVCSVHGGRAPQVRAAARRRVLERGAAAELARLDVEPVADPLTQLALLTAQAIAWKDVLAGKVNELTSLRYEGDGSGEQLRAEVALWERALDRCERFLTAMARLNIDERLAEIDERQGHVIVSFIVAALERFGIDFRDDGSYAVVMGLFDRMVRGNGEQEIAVAIEAPRGPQLSWVCEHDQHASCRAYLPAPGQPAPPPWPAACPCPCHGPALRAVPPGEIR